MDFSLLSRHVRKLHAHARAPPLDFPAMKAFTEHPRSVGESYWQHMAMSLSFAVSMLAGAGAALVHSVFPFLLTKTGSRIVSQLHERMVTHRQRVR
jgi:hypothetical protein